MTGAIPDPKKPAPGAIPPGSQASSQPEDPASQPLKNQRWEKFAQLIVSGLSADDAYQGAGYQCTPGALSQAASRLRNKDDVRLRIVWLQQAAAAQTVNSVQEIVKAAGLDQTWVIDRLMKNAQQALGEIPTKIKVRVKKKDESAGVEVKEIEIIDIDRMAANRALEMLGKHVGMFGDKTAVPPETGDSVAQYREVPDVLEQINRVRGARKLIAVPGGKDKVA